MARRASFYRPEPRLPLTLVSAVAIALVCGSPLAAQRRPAPSPDWQVPRTADGHPNLQGNWTNGTLTPFERQEGREPVLTWDEVERLERGDGTCPPNPGTVECGRAPSAGSTNEALLSGNEYNEVYWDRGSEVAIVSGEPRASLLTRPADGRRPPLTAAGERRVAQDRASRSRFGAYDHPELRPLAERCMSTRGAGPPMVPGAYNNNYTIVQNAGHVMIMTEMVHDVRIIPLAGPAAGWDSRGLWHGASLGHWDGNTLVVETSGVRAEQGFRGVPFSENARITERFTRVDAETVVYEFTIDDPVMYTEPWGGEIPMKRFDDLLYEYACHEGNYSFEGVLGGARYQEAQATSGR